MKSKFYLILTLFIVFFTTGSYSQVSGDYRSAVAVGGWETASSWETYNGTSWVAASSFPLYSISNTVTVLSGHNLTINGDPAFGSTQTYIPNTIVTGTITIASGKTLWVASTRTLTVNGTLVNSGNALQVQSGTASIVFNGTYQHAVAAGTIPTATWNTGSTCNVTGSTGAAPSGTNQNFYNFTWNCSGQSSNCTLGWNGNTINGDVTITETKSSQLRVSGTSGTSTTINGNLIINGATALFTTTGSASTTVTVNINGNVQVSAGTFSLGNSSSAVGIWNLKGNLDMTVSPATGTFRSSASTSILNFTGNSPQLFSMPASGTTITAANIQVNTGSTLNLSSTTVFGSTGSFNVQSGATLGIAHVGGIAGSITTTGTQTFSTSANYIFNGSSPQITSSSLPTSVNNLTISNTSGVSLSGAVAVANILAINAGSTLTTGANNLTLGSSASAVIAPNAVLNISGGLTNFSNRSVTLQSTSAGTGTIAPITGNNVTTGLINATNVTLQRYIPGGKRAFRFLGHPFSTALNLSALTDNILITGGSGTGFTSSTTNNPSAFWYNPATGNESTTNDPGWTAFTTADGTSGAGNIWSQYEGIRVLVRGSIADGLSPVTPSPVTLDATGTLNTGTQTIAIAKGTNSGFNLISNPFASNINLTTVGGNVTLGSNLVTNHYVWDISAGTKGGWVNTAFSSSYVLPSFSAFFVKTAANDNITITEAAKTSTAATGTLFRNTNASPQMVRLWVLGNNITWDKFELYYNKESVLENDKHDGVKMFNSEVNLYSLNNSGMYSIDSRPYVQDDVIPLGFTSAVQQTYTIKATDFNMPAGVELYLRDKFLGTETKLVEDAEYTFSVTNNPASQGNARFEIAQKAAPLQPVVTSFYVKLSPNPAKGMVKVSFSNEEVFNTQISIVNAEGKMVKQVNAGNVQAANLNINISDLAKGVYYVTLQNGKEKKTETLQVQ